MSERNYARSVNFFCREGIVLNIGHFEKAADLNEC